jgi:hypothetical protein
MRTFLLTVVSAGALAACLPPERPGKRVRGPDPAPPAPILGRQWSVAEGRVVTRLPGERWTVVPLHPGGRDRLPDGVTNIAFGRTRFAWLAEGVVCHGRLDAGGLHRLGQLRFPQDIQRIAFNPPEADILLAWSGRELWEWHLARREGIRRACAAATAFYDDAARLVRSSSGEPVPRADPRPDDDVVAPRLLRAMRGLETALDPFDARLVPGAFERLSPFEHAVIRLPGAGPERWTTAREWAIRRLGALPARAMAGLPRDPGPAAAIAAAAARGDLAALESAVDRHPWAAGVPEALDLLAGRHLEAGRPEDAACFWSRLLRMDDATLPKALVAARLAHALRAAKDAAGLDALRSDVAASRIGGRVRVGGREMELSAFLSTLIVPPDTVRE